MPWGYLTGDDDDDDSGGYSVGVPGTDYELTTDTSEADVLSTDDATSTLSSTGDTVTSTGSDTLSTATDTSTYTDAYDEYVGDPGSDAVDTVSSGVDEYVGDPADDMLSTASDANPFHVSDDWTSTEDALGFDATDTDDLHDVTGGTISDDWTSTEDALGFDATDPGEVWDEATDASPVHISDDWTSTEDALGYESDTIHSFRDFGDAILDGDGTDTMYHAGELTLNVATQGDADEFQQDFQEENPEYTEWRDRVEEGLDEGGVWGYGAAGDELVKTGVDAVADAPGDRFNLQDQGAGAVQRVTGADSVDELADQSQSAYDSWMDARSKPAEALPDWMPGSEGSTTANVVGTGFDWFVQYPAEAAYTVGTGVDPETGETDARAEPIDLIDVALVGGGSAIAAGARGSRGLRGMFRGGDDAAEGTTRVGFDAAEGTARTADDAVEGAARAASDEPGAIAATLGGAAALIGGQRAGETMVRGLSRVGRALRGGTDGTDAIRGVDSSRIGTAETPALPSGEDAIRAMDEGTPSGALPDTAGTSSIDDVMGGSARIGDDATTASRTGDDVIDLSRGDDGVFRMGDDVAETTARAGDDAADTGFRLGDRLSGAFSGVGGTGAGATSRFGDRVSDAFSGFTRSGDDAGGFTSRFTRSGDDSGGIFSRFTRSGDDATTATRAGTDGSRTTDTARTTDEALGANAGSDLFEGAVRGADGDGTRIGQMGRAGSDGQRGLDATRTGSTAGRVGDDATLLGRLTGGDGLRGAFRGARNWFGRRGWTFRIGAGILGGAIAADILGVDLLPEGGGDKQVGNYRAEDVKAYTPWEDEPFGHLFRIEEGAEGSDWQTIGYAIVIGEDPDGEFISAGDIMVVGADARPATLDPLAGDASTDQFVPQGRFGSEGEADDAYDRFIAWLEENYGEGPGTQDAPEPDEAADLDGDVEVPSSVEMGEEFGAAWYVELDGDMERASGRITLDIALPDGLVPLAESDYVIGGDVAADEGSFEVPSGWGGIEPGDYDVYAVIHEGGERVGAVAETTMEITAPGEGDGPGEGDPDDNWGEPELVEELPHGWYLFGQPHQTREEVRFMVVGVRDDQSYIYLHPNGHAREDAHHFPTVEAAAEAFEKWLARMEDGSAGEGEQPAPGAGRPQPEQVARDAAEADSGVQGLLNRMTSLARQNPLLFAGGATAAAAVVYYLYKEGYFGSLISTVRTFSPLP